MRTLDVFRTTVGAAALGFARRALDEALGHARRAPDVRRAARPTCSSRRRSSPTWRPTSTPRRCSSTAPRGRATSGRRARHARGRDGQAGRHRGGAAGDRRRRAAPRRPRRRRGRHRRALYREIRALRIYEGATEVQQLIIARASCCGRRSRAGGASSDDVTPSAHVDTFARDHLPPRDAWPEFLFDLPELQFPERLNCATELLDRTCGEGRGDRRCVSAPGGPSLDLRRAAAPGRTASPTCWSRAAASCPATACCCAPPTSRCWPPAGSR